MIERSRGTPQDFAFFRWFAVFPVVEQADGGDGHRCVTFRDLRFELPGRDELPFRYGLCQRADARAAAPAGAWQAYEFVAGARRWIAVN